jgi:hypothetical protein
MLPGDVLRWNEFSLQKGPGPDKARWFIYLGDNGRFIVPAVLFAVTTTTQLEAFEPEGPRAGHRVVRFDPAPSSPFAEACLVDVEFDRYEISASYFAECASSIEPMGQISKEKLLELWRIVETSTHFSAKVTKDIRRCFANAGYLRS